MPVGIVIISHSAALARGVAELVQQMAPGVTLRSVGGTDDGAGVVLLYDLGSARMVAEMVLETAEDADRHRLADAPLVEGALAAAVSAQGGNPADVVVQAAAEAGAGGPHETQPPSDQEAAYRDEIELTNEVGLHARPAAMLARCLQGLDTQVTVRHGGREVDAASVLGLMGLEARQGDTVEVLADGADAEQALHRIQDLARRGFDEA